MKKFLKIWKSNTAYTGLTAKSPLTKMFWKILEKDKKLAARLFEHLTGVKSYNNMLNWKFYLILNPELNFPGYHDCNFKLEIGQYQKEKNLKVALDAFAANPSPCSYSNIKPMRPPPFPPTKPPRRTYPMKVPIPTVPGSVVDIPETVPADDEVFHEADSGQDSDDEDVYHDTKTGLEREPPVCNNLLLTGLDNRFCPR